MKNLNILTRILAFTPNIATIKGSSVSKSHKLFSELGLIHGSDGINILMPLLVKSLNKLKQLVHEEMKEVSAVEFTLPILTSSTLFKISGRENLDDVFTTDSSKNKNYILSPTCEESVTNFVTSLKLHHGNLPLRLYQISAKFRDEMRPRSGLLRAKEFLMKDLYCFDLNEESCEKCYQKLVKQYHHFFKKLDIPFECVEGSTGKIGGLKSHEFHFLSDAGQDKISLCQNCGHKENIEMSNGVQDNSCGKCQSRNIIIKNGIEVGHTFKLGTRYTQPFKALYLDKGSKKQLIYMSSFGLGLTRILAASAEVLSLNEEIRWPNALAPYLVSILPPKTGSKEEVAAKDIPQNIYDMLNQHFPDDVVLDDRVSLTIGRRLELNKKLGFPIIVVIGKSISCDPPTVEVIEVKSGSSTQVHINNLLQFISHKLKDNS